MYVVSIRLKFWGAQPLRLQKWKSLPRTMVDNVPLHIVSRAATPRAMLMISCSNASGNVEIFR